MGPYMVGRSYLGIGDIRRHITFCGFVPASAFPISGQQGQQGQNSNETSCNMPNPRACGAQGFRYIGLCVVGIQAMLAQMLGHPQLWPQSMFIIFYLRVLTKLTYSTFMTWGHECPRHVKYEERQHLNALNMGMPILNIWIGVDCVLPSHRLYMRIPTPLHR
jgi:hypothetical protein